MNEKINPNDLGNVALEVILRRNEARNELAGNLTFDKKNEMERRIDELHEFERVIASLYMLQGVKSSHGKLFDLSDFTKPKYELFGKEIIS